MTRVKIITGPTCAGKSEAALRFAEENDSEIISCDSVQIYRGMDIGSAKPTAQERLRIRHSLIDVVDVAEKFDVAKYIEHSKRALAEISARGKQVVVCGGSGFYLKAWFSAVCDDVQIPESAYRAVGDIEAKLGTDGLAEALLKIDPRAAESLDIKNPRRTRRALERCIATGKSVGELLRDFKKIPCPMGELDRDVEIIDRPDAELFARIRARTEKMLDLGLVDETRKLMEKGIEKNPSAASAVGYRETIAWLARGDTDSSKLADSIYADTIALVKKQRKFFRNALFKG